MTRAHAHKPKTHAEIVAERRAEEEQREVDLYGHARQAVHILRRRGFIVSVEGAHLRVGVKLLNRDEAIEMASREAGLAGIAAPVRRVVETASGLRVGQKVALAPKAPPRPPTPKPVAKSTPAPKAAPIPKAPPPAPKPAVPAHSTNLGVKPRVVWLDLALLVIDRRYQRELTEAGFAHINQIVRTWNWNCYQPVVVTENADGTYAVIDGQHRIEAAKKHPLIDSLPCYIIDAPDVADQARIFVAVNTNRKGLTSQQKFWASHAAGDPAAVALVDICEAAGVTILRRAPASSDISRAIIGPMVCQRLVARLGREPVREAITLLVETHAGTPGAFRTAVIAALARMAATKPYSRNRLRKVLASVDLPVLLAEASKHHIGGGSASLAVGAEKLLRKRVEAMKAEVRA